MAKVSIISPVYNVEKYITNLIRSINDQTFKDFELILVDDGSTDKSVKIAEKELKKTKIKYRIISKENGGQSTARNVGISAAKGDYVWVIDSDDVIQPNYINNLLSIITSTNSDVAFCDLNWVPDERMFEITDEEIVYEVESGKKFFCDFFMHNVEIGPYSLLVRKEFLDRIKIQYNHNSRYSEEFTYICSLLHDAKTVVHLKQKLYNYCLRAGSVSTGAKIDKIVNGYNEIVKNNTKYSKCNCEYCKLYNKYAMPRWILATARFTSKNMKFSDYKVLMNKLEYRKNVRALYSFPNLFIRIVALSLNISLFITYQIFKRVGVR